MKAKEKIPDVLASRYVSKEMKQNWSMHNKVLLERDFWPVSYTHLTLPTSGVV